MVSTKSTLPNDEREAQDNAHNPNHKAYKDGIGSAYTSAGLDQLEAFANDPKSHNPDEDIREKEEDPDVPYTNNFTGDGAAVSGLQRFFAFVKRRGATIGVAGILGIGGGAALFTAAPASLVVSLASNVTETNDSSSPSLQRRFMKALGFTTTGDESGLCASSSSIKCKMGRISNSALDKLAGKGAVAYDANGPIDTKEGKGYPERNPTSYLIDMGAGLEPQKVEAKELMNFLAADLKIAARIIGSNGAIALKLSTWSGKYLSNSFFSKFGISRTGGLADGSNSKSKYNEVLAKLREKIPGVEKMNNVTGNVKAKVETHLGKAKKGGSGYVLAVAGCIAVKAPGYVAAGVAAVQLAQVMPIIMDVVLSPASKLKASGVDSGSVFSSEDMSAIGTLLTEKTPRESDGKMTAPLDSPALQSVIGVNTNKVAVSEDYTPGYSFLTSPLVLAANQANKATEPACNGIMSPAAMYTALAVDSAVTVAASATIIGGVIKVAAGWGISEVVGKVAGEIVGVAATQAISDIAANDKIASAQGEAFGDVLAVSAATFFPAGAMARNIPTLKESQVSEFVALQKEAQDLDRKMDIASLSPFDVSSRYTFMGSIVHNMNIAKLHTGSYAGGILSLFSDAIKAPLGLSTANAATGFSDASCGYADKFGLTTADPMDTPAINMAGLPCTGLTTEQASMSTETAIDLIVGEGWIDESKSIKDDDTITDLVESGYIKADTPLSDYITTCGDASTGDYLFNSASCTINSETKDAKSVTDKINTRDGGCDEDNGCSSVSSDVGDAVAGPKNNNSMNAIPAFLLDYQIKQIINGEDVEETDAIDTPSNESTDKVALAQKIVAKNKVTYLFNPQPRLEDIASGKVNPDEIPCGININILKIIDAITDSHSIKISSLNRLCTKEGSSKTSRHVVGNGSALDIATADGVAVRGRDAKSQQIISIAMPILSAAAASSAGKISNVGQKQCGVSLSLMPGVGTFSDYCTHIHFDVPPSSDPNLKYTGPS